jgi:hypothetical protein
MNLVALPSMIDCGGKKCSVAILIAQTIVFICNVKVLRLE